MINISQIFQNSGNMDDAQLQFLFDSLGMDEKLDDGIVSFLIGGEMPSYEYGDKFSPPIDPSLEGAPYSQASENELTPLKSRMAGIISRDPATDYLENAQRTLGISPTQTITKDGQDWYVYQDQRNINNSRMVPTTAVDSNPTSPYRTGEWVDPEYTSPVQKEIRQTVIDRYLGPSKSLNQISRDEAIRIQKDLVAKGYDIGTTGVDGKIGRNTLAAMRKAQAEDPEFYQSFVNVSLPEQQSNTSSSSSSSTSNSGAVKNNNQSSSVKSDSTNSNKSTTSDINELAQVSVRDLGAAYVKQGLAGRKDYQELYKKELQRRGGWTDAIEKSFQQAKLNNTPKKNQPINTYNKEELNRSKNEGRVIVDKTNGMVYDRGRMYTLENYHNNIKSRVNRYNSTDFFDRVDGYSAGSPGKFNSVSGSKIDSDRKSYGNQMSDILLNRTKIDKSTNEIIINGNRFKGKEEARKYLESKTGLKFDVGSDNSIAFTRRLTSKEEGGEIPAFLYGGPHDFLNPLYNPQFNVNNLGDNYLLGVTPQGVNPNANPYLTDIGWKKPQPVNVEFNNGQPSGVSQGDVIKSGVQQGLAPNTGQRPEEKDPSKWVDFANQLVDGLSMGTDYSVEDALYKVGESIAYNPNEDLFKNKDGEVDKTAMGFASGFNVLKGVTAGGKAVLGGARNVMSGVANQTRNQLLMNEYYRKQVNNRKNANTTNAEEGGEIPFFNDGGWLQFFEEGNGQQYSEMGPQDPREQMPLPQEMTGEYLQQQPEQAGIMPNAEVENNEYIQHPDGQVQQVEGRTHGQGGERVALEPGTKIVSDKLKLGARNAKFINNEFGLSVKAGDTYASALEKYSKKIGLKELNDQQQEYFNKLKKDTETKSEETSELNSQFLSEKINGIEQKKGLLEQLRSNFTDTVYNLQQESKKPRVQDDVNTQKKNLIPSADEVEQAVSMAYGGEIPSFADGNPIDITPALIEMLRKMGIDPESEYAKGYIQEAVRKNETVGLSAQKLYEGLVESTPYKADLPKTYNEFKNTRFYNRNFKNKDLFEQLDINYKPRVNEPSNGEPTTKTVVRGDQAKSIDDFAAYNRNFDTNDATQRKGERNWIPTYDKVNKWAKETGLNIPEIKTHADYQKFITDKLAPQLTKLYENNQIGFNNKQREILKSKGIDSNKKYWRDLTDEEKKKLDPNFITEGYVDGLPGHRGIIVKKGKMTQAEYDAIDPSKRMYDKLTDKDGIKIYAEYDENGDYKRGPDGELIFYYPGGKPVPNNKQSDMEPFKPTPKKPYKRPILPDMSLEPPAPMEAMMKAEHRYNLIDPIKMSPENQLTEINRQNDAVMGQMDGMTDTQRAAALTNLGANTQVNSAKEISGVAAANAQNQFQVDQFNNQIMNREEDQRVVDALDYEKRQLTAKALTDQDRNDFLEKNRELRIKRFNYLTKDRQIHDMFENFSVGSDGGIEFQKLYSSLLSTGMPPAQAAQKASEAIQRKVETSKDALGNTTGTKVTESTGKKP